MDEDFVRKDTFDASLKRIDQQFATFTERMEKNFAELGEHIDRVFARYNSITRALVCDVKTLNARVDSIQHRRGWDIAWTGIVIGAVIGLIQMYSK